MRLLKTLVRVCFALVVLCSPSFAQQRPFDVAWANGNLTVRATNAPLVDVVDEVAKLTGMEVVGRDKLSGSLSASVVAQPLEKALAAVLEGVNYSIGKRAGVNGAPDALVLRVLSMARPDKAAVNVTGPLHSPALDALMVEALTDHEEQVEADADDDPDYYDDIRKERLEAQRLASEGAFAPQADVASLAKLLDNYNDEIRVEALKALGGRAIPEVLAYITRALGDDHWGVRTAAVDILGAARDPQSLERIGHLLSSSQDKEVKVDALRVIAARAQRESIPYLQGYLKSAPASDDALLKTAAQQMIDEFEWRAQAARAERR